MNLVGCAVPSGAAHPPFSDRISLVSKVLVSTRRFTPHLAALVALCVVGASCSDSSGAGDGFARFESDQPAVDVTVEATAHGAGACSQSFVRHELDHTTIGPGNTASTFDGTGSGVSLGDLDGDGLDDIVLANLSGETQVLWNDGALSFSADPLLRGRFRQPATVDVDGDGDLDIVLTSGVGPPVLFENTGAGADASSRFVRQQIDGVDAVAYSMAWADLGGDGDLDVVTGSYNAELAILRNSPVLGSDTGVVVHESTGGDGYQATRVAAEAQALSVRLVDINADGRTDVLVGNDLATADGVWIDNNGGWLAVDPFSQTSFSTMSLDAADVDNDGDLDVFSTDMKPRSDDPTAAERYVEVDRDMAAIPIPDEIQQPENVLSLGDPGETDKTFTNSAADQGVDATGWSWSGLFGDLDSDGSQDLFVVTGMRSDNLFSALPNDELVEPNQAFRNGGNSFNPAPEWGINDEVGGRGAAQGDLDNDGDLDIVVNNLGSPATLFENQLCQGRNLTIELRWPASANSHALSSTVVVNAGGSRQLRTIDQARGYLSGAAPSAHLGFGDVDGTVAIVIEWPDGERSELDDVALDHHLTVTRVAP